MSTCDRCGEDTISLTMSRFNTQDICPKCETREKAHPDYAYACDIEEEHVRRGNYNYEGIGKPSDL